MKDGRLRREDIIESLQHSWDCCGKWCDAKPEYNKSPGGCKLCLNDRLNDFIKDTIEEIDKAKTKTEVLYICDRLKCEKCYEGCHLTSDLGHARDFTVDYSDSNRVVYTQVEE